MKPFILASSLAHGAFLTALMILGTLLSKPRMSYYAVDLFSSSPAGGPVQGAETGRIEAPVGTLTKAISRPAARQESRADDTLRLLSELKKKRLAQMTAKPAESAPMEPIGGADTGPSPAAGRGGSGLDGAGPGIVAESGVSFPYPWYLKTIADRLDKQWRPPREFAADTSCQVTFVIHRSGQIYGSKITQKSGDDLFDQVALRAVLYSNPLPPLPSGFPDDMLKVHMKFVGRRE